MSSTDRSQVAEELVDAIEPLPSPTPTSTTANLVLLVSKHLCHLLQNESFTSKIIQKVFENTRNGTVGVLAAVVDQVPGGESRSHGRESQASEGISLCASTSRSLFSLEEIRESESVPQDKLHTRELKLDEQPPTLSFALGGSNKINKINGPPDMQVMLPVAQTMFQANEPCILSASQWTLKDHHAEVDLLRNHTEGGVKISLLSLNDQPQVSLFMPLAQLTGPREVKTVFGNVVRELTQSSTSIDQSQYGEIIGQEGGGDTSASRELEGAVAAFLGMEAVAAQPVAVWALVIPSSLVYSEAYLTLTRSTNMALEKLRTGATTQDDLRSLRLLLWEGATLRRVLSGGGGWGNKSGLLSLEPSVDYTQKKSDSQFDLDGDDPMSFLRGIASPGDRIVFYIGIGESEVSSRAEGDETPAPRDDGHALFGVIPSSADQMPSLADGTAKHGSNVTNLSGQFGMMSETGLSIRMSGDAQGSASRSRIDVPFTRLTARSPVWANTLLRGRARPASQVCRYACISQQGTMELTVIGLLKHKKRNRDPQLGVEGF